MSVYIGCASGGATTKKKVLKVQGFVPYKVQEKIISKRLPRENPFFQTLESLGGGAPIGRIY